MPRVLVFDLLGTLLDPSLLDPDFKRHFGHTGMRQIWNERAYGLMLAATVVDEYRAFADHADAALAMLAQTLGVDLSEDERQAMIERLGHLPPFPDVASNLDRLESASRLVALTNSSEQSAKKALQEHGLADAFERVLSADESGQAKPGPRPYRRVAESLGLDPGELTMVAAHPWDLAGAKSEGYRTVFLERPGQVQNPLAPADREIASLDEL